jgi:hypothetical protein
VEHSPRMPRSHHGSQSRRRRSARPLAASNCPGLTGRDHGTRPGCGGLLGKPAGDGVDAPSGRTGGHVGWRGGLRSRPAIGKSSVSAALGRYGSCCRWCAPIVARARSPFPSFPYFSFEKTDGTARTASGPKARPSSSLTYGSLLRADLPGPATHSTDFGSSAQAN